MTQILDGKIVRDKIIEDLKNQISKLKTKPKLVIIQVGDVPESNTYIGQKIKFGEKIGAIVEHLKLPENIAQDELTSKLQKLNTDKEVHGIIVQLPIPETLDKDEIIETIDPKKDVDGLTSTNIKLLFEGSSTNHPNLHNRHPEQSEGSKDSSVASLPQNDGRRFGGFTPATTKGVITILDYYKIPIEGKHVVVVGRSSLVGKPTALAFLNRDATVTIAHRKTEGLSAVTKSADIIVVAVGKPNLITKNHVNSNQTIIDVGINVIEGEPSGHKLVGDVAFDEVSKIVKSITPVPGGIGPMTVASLFQNLLQAYNNLQNS